MSLRNLFHKKNATKEVPSFDSLPPIDEQPQNPADSIDAKKTAFPDNPSSTPNTTSFNEKKSSTPFSFNKPSSQTSADTPTFDKDFVPSLDSTNQEESSSPSPSTFSTPKESVQPTGHYIEKFPPSFKGPEDNGHYVPDEQGRVFDEDVVSPKIREDYEPRPLHSASSQDSFSSSDTLKPSFEEPVEQEGPVLSTPQKYSDSLRVQDLPSFDDSFTPSQPNSSSESLRDSSSKHLAHKSPQSDLLFIEEKKYASLLYKIDSRLKSGFIHHKSDSLSSIDESLQKQFTKLNMSFGRITKQCQNAQRIFSDYEVKQ